MEIVVRIAALIFFSLHCLLSNARLPKSVLCIDDECMTAITNGRLIRSFRHGKIYLENDDEVEIVAKSADSSNSLCKIKVGNNFFYVDASFVKESGSIDISALKNVRNPDTHGTIIDLEVSDYPPSSIDAQSKQTHRALDQNKILNNSYEELHRTNSDIGPSKHEDIQSEIKWKVDSTRLSDSNFVSRESVPDSLYSNSTVDIPATDINIKKSENVHSGSSHNVTGDLGNNSSEDETETKPDLSQSDADRIILANNRNSILSKNGIQTTGVVVPDDSEKLEELQPDVSAEDEIDGKSQIPTKEDETKQGTGSHVGKNHAHPRIHDVTDVPHGNLTFNSQLEEVQNDTLIEQQKIADSGVVITSNESVLSKDDKPSDGTLSVLGSNSSVDEIETEPAPSQTDVDQVILANNPNIILSKNDIQTTGVGVPDDSGKLEEPQPDVSSEAEIDGKLQILTKEDETKQGTESFVGKNRAHPRIDVTDVPHGKMTLKKSQLEEVQNDTSIEQQEIADSGIVITSNNSMSRDEIKTESISTNTNITTTKEYDKTNYLLKEQRIVGVLNVEPDQVATLNSVETVVDAFQKPNVSTATHATLKQSSEKNKGQNLHAVNPGNSKGDRSSQGIGDHFFVKSDAMCYPSHASLMGCIVWASNISNNQSESGLAYSPLSRVTLQGIWYLFSVSNLFINCLPSQLGESIDNFSKQVFSLSLDFIIAWILFVFHVIFAWSIGKASVLVLLKRTIASKYLSPNLTRYSELEEYNIQLMNQITNEEDANAHLSKWNAMLLRNMSTLQEEYSFATSQNDIAISESQKEIELLQSKLHRLQVSYDQLKIESSKKLIEKESEISNLTVELDSLSEKMDELKVSNEEEVDKLGKNNLKLIEQLKEEQTRLYSQANEYYNRMKTMQAEVDKILESKQQTELKLMNKETEYQSLLTTFNTLKSFELALAEQLALQTKSEKVDSIESCDFSVIDDLSDDGTNLFEGDKNNCDSTQRANSSTTDQDINQQYEAKLKASLSTFLDVGQLHVQLKLKDDQIKLEAAKVLSEYELRMDVETRYQALEKENSELKATQIQLEDEKKASEIKLGVLSDYFKERELELQRDLGKHVVVNSESSDALSLTQKRVQELEIELKVSREQLSALRREIVLTEKSSRRQVAELDKRSHENWLAARSADHQIKELREENSYLRLKLLEAERNSLPPALRAIPNNSLPTASQNIRLSGVFSRSSSLSGMKSPDSHILLRQPLNRPSSPPNILDINLIPFPTRPPLLPPSSTFQNIQLPIPPPPPPPPFPGVIPEHLPFPIRLVRPHNSPTIQSSNPPSINGSIR